MKKGQTTLNFQDLELFLFYSDLDELKTGLQQFGDDLEEGCSLAKKQLAGWNQFNQSRDELVAWLGEKQQQYSAGIPSALDLKGKEILLEQAKYVWPSDAPIRKQIN